MLGIILHIGNRLNTAGESSNAKITAGLTLESLKQLDQVKAFDRRTTVLKYIVRVCEEKDSDVLNLKSELASVIKAGKVHWEQWHVELASLEWNTEKLSEDAAYSDFEGDCLYQGESLNRQGRRREFILQLTRASQRLKARALQIQEKFRLTKEYFSVDKSCQIQPHELFQTIGSFLECVEKSRL